MLGSLGFFYHDKKEKQCIQNVHEFVGKYIDAEIKRQKTSDTKGTNKAQGTVGSARYNMLSAMVGQTSDHSAIQNNVIQGFIASHDTTAFLISNVVWVLARHPRVWTELRAEIKEQINTDPELTFDTPGRIQLLNDVLDESEQTHVPPFMLHVTR